MTCDTWEADASAVYEIETEEEGHLRWLRELISPCVKTEQNQVQGFFFLSPWKHERLIQTTSGQIPKRFDLFAGALLSEITTESN